MLNMFFSLHPSKSGIRIFGLVHIMVIIMTLVLGVIIVKRNKEMKWFAGIMTAIMLCASIGLYIWYYLSPINFMIKALPLYTCRLAVYLLAIGIYFKKDFWLKMGCYWSFFGGIAGLLFPSIFDYPFPHILQVTTFFLHVYLILVSTYYLFVKRIGMNRTDLKNCCWFTVGFLVFVTIVNMILGANYTSTLTTPLVLVKLGINFPAGCSFIIVTFGYLLGVFAEYFLIKEYDKRLLVVEQN